MSLINTYLKMKHLMDTDIYEQQNQDLKWTLEAELEKATFRLMDTDIYELYRNDICSFELYLDILSRTALVQLLEKVREENNLDNAFGVGENIPQL